MLGRFDHPVLYMLIVETEPIVSALFMYKMAQFKLEFSRANMCNSWAVGVDQLLV